MKKINFYNPKHLFNLTLIVCILSSLALYPFLPAELPMQFGSDGSVNWTLPKYLGILLIPSIVAFMSAYYRKQDTFNYSHLASVLLLIMLNIGFLGYVAFFR